MLSAINSQGRKICLLNHCAHEISLLKKLEWFCPACHSPLILKNGSIKQAHFAHISSDICEAYSENESEAHLTLKYQLAKWFQEQQNDCQIEYYLPALKQIPDLLINHRLAIEIQCSPLSIERFNARTINYLSHGYQVIWLLGEKMRIKSKLTRLQFAMCSFSVHSGVFLWQIDQKALVLIEMLHISLNRSIYFQKQAFNFFQGLIMDHFRLPYQFHSNRLLVTLNQTKNKQVVCRGLYYANPQWLSLQALCYQNGLVLQNLTDDFYNPGIFPLFYQPIRFRIEIRRFLKKFRTFSELVMNFTDEFQTPIQINHQLFISALVAFELQCLMRQKILIINKNKFKVINNLNLQISTFEIQSPLQINQWLSKKVRDGERNEERKIIDS